MTDTDIEQEIQAKSADVAPRVTLKDTIEQILDSAPDAKPVQDSLSARGLFSTVLFAFLPVIASAVGLSADDAAQAVSLIGVAVSAIASLIGILRRVSIRLPNWALRALGREVPA